MAIKFRGVDFIEFDTLLTDDERPYERAPQMLFTGRWLGSVLAFDSSTELVNFDRDE